MQQNGKTVVKMEIWVDANNDGNWLKVNEFIDSLCDPTLTTHMARSGFTLCEYDSDRQTTI
jgi:hypothetical protein